MSNRARLLAIAALTAMATLGVPAQAHAEWIPRTLGGTIRVAPVIAKGATFERTFQLPWRANAIGLSFSDRVAAGVTMVVRAHTPSGWSDWQPADPADNFPDSGTEKRATTRTTTDPIWVDSADWIDVRVAAARAPLHDLRIDLINTLGDASPPSIATRVGRALRSFFTMQPATPPADALTSVPKIITRAQWGANESWRRAAPEYAPTVRMVFVHHTDDPNNYSASQSAAIVRSIYHYHVFSRGWNDIGYNFLVDRYGQIFEGRYGGMDKAVIGAHTLGFNTYSTGIALIGTFSSVVPPSAMLKSLAFLTAWKMDLHHIPAVGTVRMTSNGNPRYARGSVVTFNRISGHRDAYPTDCPGTDGYGKISWLRSAVTNLGNPKLYLPSWTTSILRPDGDSTNDLATFAAGLSVNSAWTLTIRDSSGVTQRTLTGSGTSISKAWDGTGATGTLLPTGRYSWQITAKDSSGHLARPASGLIYLVNTHPDGTLLADSKGKYLLSQGSAATVDDLTADANFGELIPMVRTGDTERTRYTPSATSPALRAGTLLTVMDQTTNATVHYIWDGMQLRKFGLAADGTDTFTDLNYSPSATISISQTKLSTLQPAGPDVTDRTVHPAGTLIQDPNSGSMYVIAAGGLEPIGQLARRSLYKSVELVQATPLDLDPTHPQLTPVTVRDGTLVAGPDGTRWILNASQNQKRRFIDTTMFTAMGYSVAWLLPATQADLDALTTATQIG